MPQDPALLEDADPRADPSEYSGVLIPRMTALEAVRRYRLTALLPFLAFVAVAVALAASRAPVYTSEARLAIGGVDLSAPGALSGFALASQSLADTYSRAVTAQPVVDQVAKKLRVSSSEVLTDLSATPVPTSPVFRVIAKTGRPGLSREMANAAAVALRDYIQTLGGGSGQNSQHFYDLYRDAAATLQSRQIDEQNAASDYGASKSAANGRKLARARAGLLTAQLSLDGLRQNYLQTASGRVDVASVQPLTTAVDASSDRFNYFLIFLVIGAVAGALAGVALAALRGNRAMRRHFAG